MSETPAALPLFAAYGIELEYMIVRRDTGDVLPCTDVLLKEVAGEYVNDFDAGDIGWSNELVLHVVELKTGAPAPSLDPLPDRFLSEVRHINRLLAAMNGRLMPGAMHPWMDPARETQLWPHGSNEIYAAFHRIFDCTGHGWSNLQSMHVNLPFRGDGEFRALHTAIRTLLPVMPAIAASSPVMDGRLTGFMDTRLETYRGNARRIPAVTGHVVPEPVSSRADYERTILAPMFEAIAPYDPEGILQFEWLNARGAIARFDRDAIEIRVLDTQETPAADIAVAAGITAVLKTLSAQRWSDFGQQESAPTEQLAALLQDVTRDAEETVVRDARYLSLFGFPGRKCQASELWQYLLEESGVPDAENRHLAYILRDGCLARRIARSVGSDCRPSRLRETSRMLCDCLENGSRFEGID